MSAGACLTGKCAVITGAANGIGRAIAHRLAQDGALVVLGDIDAETLSATEAAIQEAGGTAISVSADLTEEAGARSLIDKALEAHGRIDILVNNLGGSRHGKIWELDIEAWDYTIRLNLRAMFLCTRFAAPQMIEQKAGRIICLSSGARDGSPWLADGAGGSAYATTKAGVHGFIRDVAMELAPFGITVNAVAPGPIDTERTGAGLRRLEEASAVGPIRLTPLGRLGTPEEVASAVAFLASDEASYVTGHTLAVSGGR